jgi:hemolysin III
MHRIATPNHATHGRSRGPSRQFRALYAAGREAVGKHHRLPRWVALRPPVAPLPGTIASVPGLLRDYPVPLPWGEEWLNALLHGLGALVGLWGGVHLVLAAQASQQSGLATAFAIYTATLVATFLCSFCSHLIHQPHWRHLFRILDQACIFLLIAGSCTPYLLKYLSDGPLVWMAPAMWVVAVAGFWSKLRGQSVNRISLTIYLGLGWFPVLAFPSLAAHLTPGCWTLIVLAGLGYSGGTWFLMNDHRRPYFHAIWHLCVLFAATCNHTAMAWYLAS